MTRSLSVFVFVSGTFHLSSAVVVEDCTGSGDCFAESGDESGLLQHRISEIRSRENDGEQEVAPFTMNGMDAHQLLSKAISERYHRSGVDPYFEVCNAGDRVSRQKPPVLATQESTAETVDPNCSLDLNIVLEKATATGVERTCCPIEGTFCSGCAVTNGTHCLECQPGYFFIGGENNDECVACADTAGWTDASGQSCVDAECSDVKVQGLSSNDACCRCHGGHQTATPWDYRVDAVLLGSNVVRGGPIPRTARRFSVDPDCQLAKYGLAIDGHTGVLLPNPETAAGSPNLGSTPFEISCTITAHQSAKLNATAVLTVKADHFAYHSFNNNALLMGSNFVKGWDVSGPQPGLALGSPYPLEIPLMNYQYMCVSGNKANCWFEMRCAAQQTTTWILANHDTGALQMQGDAPAKSPGITDIADWNGHVGAPGGLCEVIAHHKTGFPGQSGDVRALRFHFPVIFPKVWQSFSYGVSHLDATVGQSSPPIYVTPPTPVAANKQGFNTPTRFSITCLESPAQSDNTTAFSFDSLTGVGMLRGMQFMQLNISSGAIMLEPPASIIAVLDKLNTTDVRRQITLDCSVFAHFEYQLGAPNPVATTPLVLQIHDDTCWLPITALFMKPRDGYLATKVNVSSEEACRAACRADGVCTHFAWNASLAASDQCQFYHWRCVEGTSTRDCDSVTVQEKLKDCGERTTCVRLTFGHHWWLSGFYCPVGDMGHRGIAYERQFVTPEDVLWLAPCNTERDSHCSVGQWVLRKPDGDKDYISADQDVIELNGRMVAILNVSSDLTELVLAQGTVDISVDSTLNDTDLLAALQGNISTASVENPTCSIPNTTAMVAKAEEEGSEEGGQNLIAVNPIVLDDPTTATPDDHWLHPCSCFSETNWGQVSPVTSDSFADVPPGSGNQYNPKSFVIVQGEFLCEPGDTSLLRIIIYQEEDTEDFDTFCEQTCRGNSECLYFFSGTAGNTKQCRLYKRCSVLVREAGVQGSLKGMTLRQEEVCRIANPDLCQAVSYRRQYLGAGVSRNDNIVPAPMSDCLYSELLNQCDYKLLLGQMGITSCGKCSYSFQMPSEWAGKTPPPSGRKSGHQLQASCWDERYHPVPGSGTGPSELTSDLYSLTCLTGEWRSPDGSIGLGGFECATCVTIGSGRYSALQKQRREELFFTPLKELNLYVLTYPPQRISSSGDLEQAPLELVEQPDSGRVTPPDFIYGTLTNEYVTDNINRLYCLGVEADRIVDISVVTPLTVTVVLESLSNDTEPYTNVTTAQNITAYGMWSSSSSPRNFVVVTSSSIAYIADTTGVDDHTADSVDASDFQAIAEGLAFANLVGVPHDSGPISAAAVININVTSAMKYDTVSNVTKEYEGNTTITLTNVKFGLDDLSSTFNQTLTLDEINGSTSVQVLARVTLNFAAVTIAKNVTKFMDCDAGTTTMETVNLGWVYGNASSPGPILQIQSGTYGTKCLEATSSDIDGSPLVVVADCDENATTDRQKWAYEVGGISNRLTLQNDTTKCLTVSVERDDDAVLRLDSCQSTGTGSLDRGVYSFTYSQEEFIMEEQDCFYSVQSEGCSVTCGGGFERRTVTEISPARGSGQACPAELVPCALWVCNGTGSGGYLPEDFVGSSVGVKQFRSTANTSDCLRFNASGANGFSVAACDSSAMSQQIDSAQLPAMMWEIARAKAAGGAHIAETVLNVKFASGSGQRFLTDLTINKDCGDDAVIQELRWGTASGAPGLMVRCSAAVINSNAREAKSQALPLADLLETKEGGYCASATYNDLPGSNAPWIYKWYARLKWLAWIQMLKCDPDDESQQFYFDGYKIKNKLTGLCLRALSSHINNYTTLRSCSYSSSNSWSIDKKGHISNGLGCLGWMKAKSGEDAPAKVVAFARCFSSSEDPQTVQSSKMEPAQQLWRMGSGILGLSDSAIACSTASGSVLHKFRIANKRLYYDCAPLGAVGACYEKETAEVDTVTKDLAQLPKLDMNCTRGALLKVVPELSTGGDSIKFKYMCCDLTEPAALVLTGVNYSSLVPENNGVYCAKKTRDVSGRLMYEQQSWFNTFSAPTDTNYLTFDHLEGKWCVSNSSDRSCAVSDFAVPTDGELSTTDWESLETLDFDYSPEPRGVSAKKKRKREFPQLIQFKSIQPEYRDECKDEVTPGESGFDRDLMRKSFVDLPSENPCSLIGGLSAAESPDGEAAGFAYRVSEKAYQEDGEMQYGVTYKDAYDCSTRAINRNGEVFASELAGEARDLVYEGVESIQDIVCDSFPDVDMWAGIFGGGEVEWEVDDGCKAPFKFYMFARQTIDKIGRMINRDIHEDNDRNDCDPLQAGMARVFCDLHCIRDSVTAGDEAILKSMEKAAKVQTENNRLLLDYYSGTVLDTLDEMSDSTAFVQDPKQTIIAAQKVSDQFFKEMKEMASVQLSESGRHTLIRSLEEFLAEERSKGTGNLTADLAVISKRVERLHAVIKSANSQKLSQKADVERRVHDFVVQNERVLTAMNRKLGHYKVRSSRTKHLQEVLFNAVKPELRDVALQIESQGVEQKLLMLDSTWWKIRSYLDKHLKAAKTHVESMQRTTSLLKDYVSMCALPYKVVLASFHKSVSLTETAKNTLQESWRKVLPLMGQLISQITDGNVLQHFARADMMDTDVTAVLFGESSLAKNISRQKDLVLMSRTNLCSSAMTEDVRTAAKNVLHDVAFGPAGKGLWSGTMKQVAVVLAEIRGMSYWHGPLGLGKAPDVADADLSVSRMRDSVAESIELMNSLVEDGLGRAIKEYCKQ